LTDTEVKAPLPLKFILGLLNSSLESFYFCSYVIDQSLGGGLIHATPGAHDRLIVPQATGDKIQQMVCLVDALLSFNQHLALAKSAAQKEVVRRQIGATDAEIDRLVYDLYELTPDEIAMVEGK
jgi:hypothetical protein